MYSPIFVARPRICRVSGDKVYGKHQGSGSDLFLRWAGGHERVVLNGFPDREWIVADTSTTFSDGWRKQTSVCAVIQDSGAPRFGYA
jgi:hypothetical protein